MKHLTFALCLAGITTAGAHAATRLEVPVTYMADASVVDSTKSDCKIEEMLSSRVGPMLGKLNKNDNGTLNVGSDPAGDTVLRLQITHVLGVGGGAWSGPKAITVLAELLENGKVVQNTKINEWTTGGLFGGYMGTCAILKRSADAITNDLNEWVQNPSSRPPEPSTPKEAPKEVAKDPVKETPQEVPMASAETPKAAQAVPVAEQKTQN